jgi:uncharacterized membrane protein
LVEVQHIHPILVHFVIAPLVIAIVFDFLWLIKKYDYFEKFSWYSLIIVGVSGILSVLSGLMAEENVIFPESSLSIFEYHENMAFLLIVFLAIQVLWRFSLKGKIPRKNSYLYFIVTSACLISVIATSYFGGKLVFDYGIGVNSEITVDKDKNNVDIYKPKFQFVKPDSSKN